MTPIPAWQCDLHIATLLSQRQAEPSLFPPSVARGQAEVEHRDALLELLSERTHDTSSLTRAKVMQVWCMLTKEYRVPMHFWHTATGERGPVLHLPVIQPDACDRSRLHSACMARGATFA